MSLHLKKKAGKSKAKESIRSIQLLSIHIDSKSFEFVIHSQFNYLHQIVFLCNPYEWELSRMYVDYVLYIHYICYFVHCSQYLKITSKVSFKIESESSYIYIRNDNVKIPEARGQAVLPDSTVLI